MKPAFDFIVIGAQKAGTTALHEYIRRHPEVSVPAGKEAPFYSHDSAWSAGWRPYAEKAFAFAPETTRWGVATPHYMLGSLYQRVNGSAGSERPEWIVPGRIKQHAPGAKLIAILRDPVERAYSHYRMQVLRGAERAAFADAVGALLQPAALERSRRYPTEETSYVTTGEYGRILAPYFELFGDQVLVCFSRDLDREPEAVLQRVWSFLGIDADFVPDNLGRRYRVAGERKRAGWLDIDRLQSVLAGSPPVRGAWHALPPTVRMRIDAAWNELNYRLELWNRKQGQHGNGPSAEVDERLRGHFAADRAQLVALLGEEPPWA